MTRRVIVDYDVTCETQQEYDDIVAFLADAGDGWSITSQDAASKRILFHGDYNAG